jgi:hypothetical protein
MNAPESFDYKHVGGRFLGLAALTLVLVAVLFGSAAHFAWTGNEAQLRQFAFSYLFAYVFYFTICAGCLFWTIVHHAVDAEWSVVVRRVLENLGSLLLTLMILFIPFLFVAPQLWEWMRLDPAKDHLLHLKQPWLTDWFFWLRTSIYFLVLVLAAVLLRAFSVAQDTNGDPRFTVFNRRVAFTSAIPFAICLTFAGVDWLMALDFRWYSTMWGVYVFAGSALSAMCVLVLVVTALKNVRYLRCVTLEHYHIMGKLMLSFTIFWAYIAFSQYMLIWYANIPEETVYYLLRTSGSWWYLSQFLVIGHFFVPFLLLLFLRGKRDPRFLCVMALWILFMHMMDIYVVVLPVLHTVGVNMSLYDVLSLVTIGCVLAVIFLKKLGDSSLYPNGDPRLPQSENLQN